ncbi:hypothetical protein DEU56DRAFT_750804 [Suillus clintonianus]|uniref:uncharacterized protein n=1 Tax=Suillus clintonianus TaxID=1904413 RepID=UPI001B87D3E0|nr:uncharacterized protein DEU56DRAFT_750804 [Suillus clintonianus]KAG2156248.1 hypothetical protein DEU56DRAFT_750804 [Suillus clintonianus]
MTTSSAVGNLGHSNLLELERWLFAKTWNDSKNGECNLRSQHGQKIGTGGKGEDRPTGNESQASDDMQQRCDENSNLVALTEHDNPKIVDGTWNNQCAGARGRGDSDARIRLESCVGTKLRQGRAMTIGGVFGDSGPGVEEDPSGSRGYSRFICSITKMETAAAQIIVVPRLGDQRGVPYKSIVAGKVPNMRAYPFLVPKMFLHQHRTNGPAVTSI